MVNTVTVLMSSTESVNPTGQNLTFEGSEDTFEDIFN